MDNVTHTLTATPPFDFRQSLAALAGFSPCSGEQRIREWLSLDDDLRPFLALAKDDPVARRAAAQLQGLHQVRFPSPFEAACWFILSQRCPPSVARTLKARLVSAFGGAVRVDGQTHATFPEAADVGDRAAVGVIGHAVKAARIASAARAFAEVDERFLREGDFAEVRDFLLAIDGVGAWTAAAVMLRGLGRTDDLRGSEWQLAPIVSRLYQRPLDEASFRALADRYGRHQGYWAYYLRNAGTAASPDSGICVSV